MKKKGRGHAEHGVVTSCGEDHTNTGHVRVTVRHGKKKKDTKKDPFPFGDRETTLSVPKHKAKHYPVGKKVRIAIHPEVEDTDDDNGRAFDSMFGGKGV